MSLLSLDHVSMHFGGPLLLDDVVLDVEPGARIGVVGGNGAGKSTLLNVMAGRLEPTAGRVVRGRRVRVAHQAQELTFAPGATVLDEMRRAFDAEHARGERLRDLEERMAEAPSEEERKRLLSAYEALLHEHEAAGGYDVERRIETTLSSLGLPEEAWTQPVAGFSGGERNVIGLARALLADPDVLLLDEPSNHLDMDGVEWFVEFVRASPAAIVLVSHDRHVLDATVSETWEVRGGKVVRWAGSWSDFQRAKAKALEAQAREWRAQQRFIRRIEFQARRLKDMASAYDAPAQAKRAKAMLARVERMEKVEKPEAEATSFRAGIERGERHGRIALAVNGFSFAYGDRAIFENADLEIEHGERVCLVGPNGSGKTTLLRELLAHGSWENPVLRLGKSVRVGEYKQIHDDALDLGVTLIDWATADTGLLISEASALLHRFLFRREDLDRTVGTLSGGEKSRLQLARLVHRKVNLLLLDEPTNHLDLAACETLEETLEEYDGTLLVVSHDRYFLDRLVTRVVEVKDRRLDSHRGSFAEWWTARRASGEGRRGRALELRSRKVAAARAPSSEKEAREDRKAREREVRRLRNGLRSLEQRIERLESRQSELNARLERAWSPGGDRAEALALSSDVESVRSELSRLYAEWESVGTALGDDA